MNKPNAVDEVIKIQENDRRGMDSFIKKYERIVDIALELFENKHEEEVLLELRHEGFLGFFYAIKNFQIEKCNDEKSLLWYIFKYVHGFMLDFLKRQDDEEGLVSSYQDVFEDPLALSPEDLLCFSDMFEDIVDLLNDREKFVLERSLKGLNNAEIGQEIGVSRTRIGHNMFALRQKALMALEGHMACDLGYLVAPDRSEAEKAYFERRNRR
jgi:RNA polymerase sigma factor (sigma-70 family)